MLARSFLIQSSSKLLVTRTGIKAWSSSTFGRIRPLILELLVLEWRKFHTFELEYLWSQLANLDQILCVASLGWGKGCIRWPHWPWHIGLRWAIVALWATCSFKGYLVYFFIFIIFLIEIPVSKHVDPDQTPHSAENVAFDLGLHCLPMSQK